MVSQWFEDKKGLATGIAYCGSGLGSAVMVPIITRFVDNMGWQWGYRWLAAVSIAILIPAVLLVKEKPEDIGLEPYRTIKTPDHPDKPKNQADLGFTLKEAIHLPVFWILLVAFFFISICAAGTNTHTIPYLTDIGYTPAFASTIFSVFAITLTVGKILLGDIFDRFGALAGSIFVGICCVTFPVLALFASTAGIPWLYAVFLGFASCGFSIPLNVLIIRYFGTKDFPAILSFCSMITTFGASLSVPMMGAMYDSSGSYVGAWGILGIMAVIAMACLVIAYALSKRLTIKPALVKGVT